MPRKNYLSGGGRQIRDQKNDWNWYVVLAAEMSQNKTKNRYIVFFVACDISPAGMYTCDCVLEWSPWGSFFPRIRYNLKIICHYTWFVCIYNIHIYIYIYIWFVFVISIHYICLFVGSFNHLFSYIHVGAQINNFDYISLLICTHMFEYIFGPKRWTNLGRRKFSPLQHVRSHDPQPLSYNFGFETPPVEPNGWFSIFCSIVYHFNILYHFIQSITLVTSYNML